MKTKVLTVISPLLVAAIMLGLFGLLSSTERVVAAEHGDNINEHKTEAEDAEEVTLKPQATCPIMGGKINKELFVEHEGKKIYVCCQMCLAKVKQDPEAALKTLASRGEEAESLEPEQKLCPVMGSKINKELFVEHEGKKIYVCCKMCLAKVKQDPAKYAEMVAKAIKEAKEKEAEADQGSEDAEATGKTVNTETEEHQEHDH